MLPNGMLEVARGAGINNGYAMNFSPDMMQQNMMMYMQMQQYAQQMQGSQGVQVRDGDLLFSDSKLPRDQISWLHFHLSRSFERPSPGFSKEIM